MRKYTEYGLTRKNIALHYVTNRDKCYIRLHDSFMSTVINEIKYITASELLEELDVTRQTLWRWRQEGKIPAGHRYRGRHVLFSTEEAEAIKEFANRIEPIDGSPDEQLSLFNGNQRTKGSS
jgi:hypothetical protein